MKSSLGRFRPQVVQFRSALPLVASCLLSRGLFSLRSAGFRVLVLAELGSSVWSFGMIPPSYPLCLQSPTSITLPTGRSSTSSGWISDGGGGWSNFYTSAAEASPRATTAPSASASRTRMEATPASSQVEARSDKTFLKFSEHAGRTTAVTY